MTLIDELNQASRQINIIIRKSGDNGGYYSAILSNLNEMIVYAESKIYDKAKRDNLRHGTGRILMDNISFTESELGDRIYKLMKRFQDMEDKQLIK